MSAFLWKYYLEDDVDGFCELLAKEQATDRASGRANIHQSPSFLQKVTGTSPIDHTRSPTSLASDAHGVLKSPSHSSTDNRTNNDITLGREEINWKDGKGMTILHYIASSNTNNASTYALAVLSHPHIDLYTQDLENGWTALHRAFYFGNVTIARAIIDLDSQTTVAHIGPSGLANTRTLMKVKDKEGLGPYDLLAATITDRTLRRPLTTHLIPDDDSSNEGDAEEASLRASMVGHGTADVIGDELYTFGSNCNCTLGFGDEDDRQFPERVFLRRPKHLLQRFHGEALEETANQLEALNPAHAQNVRSSFSEHNDISELPSTIRARTVLIKDVQMAKFSTAILTDDPISNLYICGHGFGGRLGLGNERTQFQFTCLDDFGGDHRKILAVALGQDHSLAITDDGSIYSWGSNANGQLGTGLPKPNAKPEECVQLVPKQLFGNLKREVITGVAASKLHSVAHTSTSIFTWGRNHGQLGITDAHASSVEIQATPRRVAASRFSCGIKSVSANDRATVCLLEDHEVHVFANFGIVKVHFPLDNFSNYFLKSSFLATKYNKTPNKICKITSGGNTIAALTTNGEIFTVTVNQLFDHQSSSNASTTHPNKIKAALTTPNRAWSLKKDEAAARDVGVDQDGSIILCTQAGSVWRRIRRPKTTVGGNIARSTQKTKDFKFARVPNLTRAVGVRASASGAYCAIKSDCNLTREMIEIGAQNIWDDVRNLQPFRFMLKDFSKDRHQNLPKFWTNPDELGQMINTMSQSKDPEQELIDAYTGPTSSLPQGFDMLVGSTSSDIRIPLHRFVFAGRSIVGRKYLLDFKGGNHTKSEFLNLTEDSSGVITALFSGFDILTIFEVVFFMYTDAFVSFWQHSRKAPHLAHRYRQLRLDVMKLASRLSLPSLESAVRRMFHRAEPCLDKDLQVAVIDSTYLMTGDTIIELADGDISAHSVLLSQRCPFFEALFVGHAEGRWLAQRHKDLENSHGPIRVDLTHVDIRIFKLVLRHIYADSGEELFDDIITRDLEEFQDLILEVMSVANELMLDRLTTVCQAVLGRYVNVRNACPLLNAVAPSSVKDFKTYVLEYICLSLETMLYNHYLDELDEDLLQELDQVVRDNQIASLPYVRNDHAFKKLVDKYPEVVDCVERGKQVKIDALNLRIRRGQNSNIFATSLLELENHSASPTTTLKKNSRPNTSPLIPLTPKQEASSTGKELNRQHNRADEVSGSFTDDPTKNLAEAKEVSAASPSRTRDMKDSVDTPGKTNASPWASPGFSSEKLNLKDIMSQASSSRTSNLSLGLKTESRSDDRIIPFHASKISQRERKRQQQREALDIPSISKSPSPSPGNVRSSPWQTVTPSSTGNRSSSPVSINKSPTPQRSITTPQLTMRQTVANTPSPKQSYSLNSSKATNTPQMTGQQRSLSSPQVPRTTPSTASEASASPRTAQIQSIQHQPSPSARKSSAFAEQRSLANIIYEEQAGKTAIKDAVAKRSLQEIQQEQEFQEWWDQESRAVQEAAAKAANTKEKTSSKGRRKRGGKGKERERND